MNEEIIKKWEEFEKNLPFPLPEKDTQNTIDKECIELCKAINSIEGLYTIESCCGHGDHEFRIWFEVADLTYLPILLYYTDPCHVGFRWTCTVETECGMSPVHFCLESESIGEEAYKEAKIIAAEIERFLETGVE